jgi:Fe2+ or Zn2+ uptake regulation protein
VVAEPDTVSQGLVGTGGDLVEADQSRLDVGTTPDRGDEQGALVERRLAGGVGDELLEHRDRLVHAAHPIGASRSGRRAPYDRPVPRPSGRREAIDTAAGRLRAAGQRLTAPRLALVEALARAHGPLTIPELQRRAPDLATSSAYRNLLVLEEVGVVHRIVTTTDHARYELAEDLTEHHHHLICSRCGTVQDVPASSRLEESVRRAADEIARATGFRTQQHRVDLVGICTRCR